MKKLFMALFLALLFFGCQKNVEQKKETTHTNSLVKYTSAFELKENKNHWQVLLKNDTLNNPNFDRIVVTSSSLLYYFVALEAQDKLIGITHPKYVFNEKIQENLKNGITTNIGNETGLDFEKIIQLKPELVISYHNASFEKTHRLLEKLGIKVILIDEYLASTPLEKSEYVKLIGFLTGKKKESLALFSTIENNYKKYKDLANSIHQKPTVFTGIMYGDSWFVPSGDSFIAKYLEDAGADYIFKDKKGALKSFPLSFESVYKKAHLADFWLNASNVSSLKELSGQNKKYEWFKAFQKKKVYNYIHQVHPTTGANNYYEKGTLRSDIVLKDLIQIIHPTLFAQKDSLYFYKQID